METHTHYEDYSKIKGWFENKQYKVFYTAMSQKEYYEKTKEIKIKEIKNNKNLTEREKEIQINNWNANTMVYSVKYAGGIIVLVKSQIKQYFTESMLIPQNRGITLHSPNIQEGHNTYLHFIYGPPQLREAEKFWEETKKKLQQKINTKNTHYIIGDLNIHMNKELDTNS